MGILKTRKNKKFGYNPRHYEAQGDGNPFSITHKFDQFRSTVGDNQGLKGKFKNAFEDLRSKQEKKVRMRLILIIAILILAFLFIIGFDLSIFYTSV